ncbi:helix-turn-helix domain-containing protein [Sinorhizobium fredii]|uniref:helix-turn-helix domain-containing protein n=1 Tax=Rhizobium fredii TaxID=380 RepID=UPI0013E8C7EC|nr:helix-turn-helix domain-containing protein [Sinorhizobium fredii]
MIPTDDMNEPLLYTSEQTAGMLNISTKTLREFVKAGEIAYVPLGVGRTRPRLGFHLDDIHDFIKRRRTRDCPPARPARRSIVKSVNSLEPYGFMERFTEMRAEKEERKRMAALAKLWNENK